jgi:hypothetical protein
VAAFAAAAALTATAASAAFFLANTATSVAAVLKPAGLEFSKDIISTAYPKDPADPAWKDDPA